MTKEELEAAIANLDADAQEENAEIAAAASAAQSAIATAGSEYDAQIAAAEEQAAGAIEQYNADVTTAQTKQQTAAATAEAVTVTDASTEIAAIGTVTAPTVASNDVADIQAALDALVLDLNARIAEIVAAITALNNPDATEGLKSAATDLAESNAAIINAALPPAVDTQPEIDETFSLIEGLR